MRDKFITLSIRVGTNSGAHPTGLGEVMYLKDDKDKACQYFKRGLQLASKEVITHLEDSTGQDAYKA